MQLDLSGRWGMGCWSHGVVCVCVHMGAQVWERVGGGREQGSLSHPKYTRRIWLHHFSQLSLCA